METKLKYLAPHLPFKVYVWDTIRKKAIVMNMGDGSSANWVGIRALVRSKNNIYLLILHPLSDLTKPIEHNGEKFVPIIELARNYAFLKSVKGNSMSIYGDRVLYKDENNYMMFWVSYEMDKWGETNEPCFKMCEAEVSDDLAKFNPTKKMHCPKSQLIMFNKLFEWHFAVNIPDGLWIDVNELKTNPYK